eukprot:Rhum_TRINITY_DN14636_c1_g1::Rhum_TRINITY_DN14636_c1_g1_i1::g.104638::m.104638/K02471/bacA; vitamin B12/bleomycin/antimicrobial peptide transport system ATP-binding/permease protein
MPPKSKPGQNGANSEPNAATLAEADPSLRRRKKKKQKKAPEEAPKDFQQERPEPSPAPATFLGRTRQVVLPVFGAGNQRRVQTLAWSAVLVALLVVESWVSVTFSGLQRNFTNAMSDRKEDEFWVAIRGFAWMLVVAAIVYAIEQFARHTVICELRQYLTEKALDLYLVNKGHPLAFYSIADSSKDMDNPGQRIVDDARYCSEKVVTLAATVLDKMINIASFVYVLYNISPPLVLFAIGYSAVGTWFTNYVFASKLEGLHDQNARAEAGLRHLLMCVHQYREEIAFYRGGARERQVAGDRYHELHEIHAATNWADSYVEMFRRFFVYLTILAPYLALASAFFATGSTIDFGQVSQTSNAFWHIRSGFGILVEKMPFIASAKVSLNRLGSLVDALEHGGRGGSASAASPTPRISIREADSADIRLRSVTVLIPSAVSAVHRGVRRAACRRLDLHIKPGMRVLVTGPNGCGKTSLLRAVAGLFTEGEGTITRPRHGVFFLPQKLYMPVGGLRAQVKYPHSDADPEDAALQGLLDDVGLNDLPQRAGGWAGAGGGDLLALLSPGEQQRIGFARLLHARPRLALLDEATSAVDEKAEAHLYRLLARGVPTYLTVGHSPTLLRHHTHVLRPDPEEEGRWILQETGDFSWSDYASPASE